MLLKRWGWRLVFVVAFVVGALTSPRARTDVVPSGAGTGGGGGASTSAPNTWTATQTYNADIVIGNAFVLLGGNSHVLNNQNNGGYTLASGVPIAWASFSPVTRTSTGDSGLDRIAAGVIGSNNGTFGGSGWLQMRAGRSMLAANFTNANATLTNTALSITVIAGRKYAFEASLFPSDGTAADGVQIDFNGGTATVTNFIAHCVLVPSTGVPTTMANATTAALATVINASALTNTSNHLLNCRGGFEPLAAGTFIIRAAENTDGAGTLTVARGSSLWYEDMP